ncbi:hypothetical protein B7894_24140 [Salmonella enterica subsp. enterica serovar Typhimurium]|uniref:Uncharacterized protein n=1 Tax=Salmonella enterica subsp. enterica serovar Typhimurium var. 5- TaxID=1620419 RepID=A0A5Z5Q4Q8_SALTM|nr:hypothetical protein [Salmonella enterica]ECM3903390.1 hypothetical protein [Salmonella enterica subsp. enterica serovar Typhimurium]ECS2466636.1 hypothetical protein [Salmonella enterica subsp. enterica serovar Typhimurium var. 5-]EBQ7354161.1 hypothetical protein [Salmonella enterica]ECV4947785.1 hypothetical protein [Salmonella enterica subsp. enterica serovar Typhimurium]
MLILGLLFLNAQIITNLAQALFKVPVIEPHQQLKTIMIGTACIAYAATSQVGILEGTVAKLAMRQPFVLFKGLTFQKLCLPGAFRPGDHHNKMLRPGLCVVHASPQYL